MVSKPQVCFSRIEYLDEAGNDPPTGQSPESTSQEQCKAYVVSSFTTKNFFFEGVTFSTVEFPSKARTFSRSLLVTSQMKNSSEHQDSLTTLVHPTDREGANESEANSSSDSFDVLDERRHDVLFGKLCGRQEVGVMFLKLQFIWFLFLFFCAICAVCWESNLGEKCNTGISRQTNSYRGFGYRRDTFF